MALRGAGLLVGSRAVRAARSLCRRRVKALGAPGTAPQFDAELLELAVQVRALEAGAVGNARHAVAFLGKLVLEVDALELVPRLAQRLVEIDGEGLRALRA